MRQKIKRFLSILCMMTVIAFMVTVMPVSAEEVQGSMAESEAVVTEIPIETEVETQEEMEMETEETLDEPAEQTELAEPEADVEEDITVIEPVGAENVIMETVSGNDALQQTDMEAISTENVGTEATGTEAISTKTASEETASEALTYTDEQGNLFTYELDEGGNATITGITVSGAALVIPERIDEAPVIAVNNANQCVVTNPGIRIPELTINCHTIGERAFYETSIGMLTIGEDVKAFIVCNDGDYSYNF